MVSMLLIIIYVSFISLGLPDALLGAAWPTMQPQFDVPVSYMGMVSIIISAGTITSSLLSDRLTRKFGPGRVTAFSVAATAVALLGFSGSNAFWQICLWAIPYGLGAGGVDASLNNYVALHYASRHMSWLHCMWGVGVAVGPYIMGYVLTSGQVWNTGYLCVGLLQVILCAVLFASVPKWKRSTQTQKDESPARPLSVRQVLSIPGAKAVLLAFLCYCAFEQTAGMWASSYFVLKVGLSAEEAAGLASLYYMGLTVGRFFSGFLTIRFSDHTMVRAGSCVMLAGVLVMLLPFGKIVSVIGLLLAGLGSAPVYPCIIHSTPVHFGSENSQAVIGMQMAAAYSGCLIMPPLFGIIAEHISMACLPLLLAAFLAVMIFCYEWLLRVGGRMSAGGR